MTRNDKKEQHQGDRKQDPYGYTIIRKTTDFAFDAAQADSERTMRFLIIQFRQIGDVLLTLPVAQAIKRQLPSSYVAFLVENHNSKSLQTS